MDERQIITWLHQHFEEDSQQEVNLEDIINLWPNASSQTLPSKTVFGKYIRKAFHLVKLVNVRCTHDWNRKYYVYRGIRKRTHNQMPETVSFEDIEKYIQQPFFITEMAQSYLKFSKFTDKTFSGTKLLLEIQLSRDGDVGIFIDDKSISERSGLSKFINFDAASLTSLLASLQSLKYCQGISRDTFPDEMKENSVIHKYGGSKYIVFSSSCEKVVHFQSKASTQACSKCNNLAKQMSISASQITLKKDVQHDTAKRESQILVSTPVTDKIMPFLHKEAPFLSQSQLDFLKVQLQNSNVSNKHQRKWDCNTIQLCLSLWTRSPKTYENLISSGCLQLPSVSTLRRYKNTVNQNTGINQDVFKWMYMEVVDHRKLPSTAFYGGLVLDEMSLQQDIQIVKKDSKIKLIGFEEVEGQPETVQLANHVLQFVYHSFSGFRFPIAHYPTSQANAQQLYSIFWEIVSALELWGFHPLYVSVDGASNNRTFIKTNFESSPSKHNMAAYNPCSEEGHPVVFLADPSHLFKKLRNNLLKSGNQKWHTRYLTFNGNPIIWKMWIDCYEWDRQHGLSLHHKLTNDHIHPNKAEIMRNHLAEEVLDADMLNLMVCYQQHLGVKGSVLDGAITLLQHTSQLISIFHDRRPIQDNTDERLTKLRQTQEWFCKWEETESANHLMSWETREDIHFLISGFLQLVSLTLQLSIFIKPVYINSDIIENHFCQQRGLHHGSSANPSYNQYRSATNSIILGQNTVSNKSNAARGKKSHSQGAMPFTHLCKKLKM